MTYFWFPALLLLFAIPLHAQDNVIQVEQTPLSPSLCSGAFVAHELDHTTMVDAQPVRMFDSNGSGLAINDLDNDGWLDIVLANLDAPGSILWNAGNLTFTREDLPTVGRARGVTTVDVDGDGWLDIVVTMQTAPPFYLHNETNRAFERRTLRGVSHFAYTLNWEDADGDGDLDLVTGSYDAELEQLLRDSFLLNGGAGVYFYENQDGEFEATRVEDESQALAIAFADLDGDGTREIAVGNDFAVPDGYWRRVDHRWEAIDPFDQITHSTMSFDWGDLENDGSAEWFAADMKPYLGEPYAAWQPVLNQIQRFRRLPDDPQIVENVLQARERGRTQNLARRAGIYATGWSWSSKFGDLNSDGLLDLYVVNGMIAIDLFPALPNGELVEENQAFRNTGNGRFEAAPEWSLNSTGSGRGMSMADLDNDGDLDVVVNNLLSPAQLFENQLCGGANVTIDLRREDSANTRAIGATVTLHTSTGTYQRDVRAASGYLSGDPAQVHIGLPNDSEITDLEIDWGDGDTSRVEDVTPNTNVRVRRGAESRNLTS